MKNLFSINISAGREAKDLDENPYLAARVSDAVRDRLIHAFDGADVTPIDPEAEAAEKTARRRANRIWLGSVLCLFAAIAVFAIGNRTGMYEGAPALHAIDMTLVVVGAVLASIARRRHRRLDAMGQDRTNMDFTAAAAALEAAAVEAARELGVPRGARSLEVLAIRYKPVNGQIKIEAGKGKFENIAVSAFREGDALCMATAQTLYRVPLSAIGSLRTVDEEFEIDFWTKPEDSDAPRYAPYHIRRAGLMGRKCRPYYAVPVGEAHEFFLPCYDLPVLRELVPVTLDVDA